MTTEAKITVDQIVAARAPLQSRKIRSSASEVGRFSLHFLETVVAMMAGMPLLFSLRNLIPASSGYADIFIRGTNLYDLARIIFMTVPMVIWMLIRGHNWRHSAEMAVAMSAPVAAVILVRLLWTADTYPSWLIQAGYTGMFLGMIIAMLYRRDHYTCQSQSFGTRSRSACTSLRNPFGREILTA